MNSDKYLYYSIQEIEVNIKYNVTYYTIQYKAR